MEGVSESKIHFSLSIYHHPALLAARHNGQVQVSQLLPDGAVVHVAHRHAPVLSLRPGCIQTFFLTFRDSPREGSMPGKWGPRAVDPHDFPPPEEWRLPHLGGLLLPRVSGSISRLC